MVLSGAEVKMIDDASESIGNNENGVSQVKGSNVKGTANCESQVAPKWPGLDTVHVLTEEEIDCHNKYIDNLISTEIENEKCEMLLYLDELLEMSEKDLIKDTDLKQLVPEEIVIRIHNNEFVNAEVLEKYVSMKFSDEHKRYAFNHTQSHFMEICDTTDSVCDVIGIKFQNNKTGKRNWTYIHYIIQGQPLEIEKPKRVKYSDFHLNASRRSSRISLGWLKK